MNLERELLVYAHLFCSDTHVNDMEGHTVSVILVLECGNKAKFSILKIS